MQTQLRINEITANISSLSVNGEVGTGTTAPALGDTDLDNDIVNTDKALTSTSVSGNTIRTKYVLGTSEANSNDITEYGTWNGSVLESRYTFTALSKTASISMDIITGVTITQTSA